MPNKTWIHSIYWLWGHQESYKGIIQTLFDHIVQKYFSKPSIWPQQRSLSKISQKYIKPILVKVLNFWGHCSLFQLEFLNNFCLSMILTYDIHNKISKSALSGHFCSWPLLASFRGFWKTFFLKLTQHCLVGRFGGLIECF